MTKLISMKVFARTCVLWVSIALVGCGDKDKPKPIEKDSKASIANVKLPGGTKDQGTVKKKGPPVITPPPPVAQVPPVIMSQQHRDQIEIFQKDAVPAELLDGELLGLDGKSHTLRSQLGDKLTIVLFWSSDHAYAVEELQFLATNFVEKFGDRGVKIVTINQRDTEKQARDTAGGAGASSLVTLLDGQKTLGKLANGNVPRTYLLDAEGRVLWLDTVFDRTTQRDLYGAIDFVLNKS
jgi:thiol-disulfide isomerase/thioredoxin